MKPTSGKQKTHYWKTSLLALALPMLAACVGQGTPPSQAWLELPPSNAQGAAEVLNITGAVRHLDVEGGVFVIRDAQGTQYNPSNLPDAFRVDGLEVQAQAYRSRDMASIGMVGPMIELLRIKRNP